MDDTKTGVRAESNLNADRDEEFNTRYGSFRGSQMAIERVKPIPRDTAQIRLADMVSSAKLKDTTEVVDYMIHRFMRVPPSDGTRRKLVSFLDKELGTPDISAAQTYMEEPLRLLLHLIMSQPEYQLS
jgi:glutamate/tyrosine decarboxylase-like PLP-dependent enzyme